MKLYATQIDENNWGDPMFLTDIDMTSQGLIDVSSIINVGKHAYRFDKNFITFRNIMRSLIPSDLSTLTQEEIDVLREYSLYQYYKIHDSVGDGDVIKSDNPPIDVNYDIIGLAKKRTFHQGELVKVEYYETYNPTAATYHNLVIVENRSYYRINQLLNSRIMTISWIMDDGSTGYTKTTYKNYTPLEAIQAGQARRENVIADLEINVIGLLMALGTGGTGTTTLNSLQAQMNGAPFLSTYNSQLSKFVQGFEQDIKAAIAADTQYAWLNLVIPNTGGITIRQYLIAGLTIDYTENNTYI